MRQLTLRLKHTYIKLKYYIRVISPINLHPFYYSGNYSEEHPPNGIRYLLGKHFFT